MEAAGPSSPTIPAAPARSSLLPTYWRDPEYLRSVPLTSRTALDYFSLSHFFDQESTNQVLRMQNIANPQAQMPGMGKSARQQEEELKRFQGIEFVLVHSREPTGKEAVEKGDESLYVVQKRRRTSPTQTAVLETYYILNGNVHVAPDLETVLQNRLVTALDSLRASLSLARAAQARPIAPPSARIDDAKKGKSGKAMSAASGTTLGAEAVREAAAEGGAAGGAQDEDEELMEGGARSSPAPPPANSKKRPYPIASILEAPPPRQSSWSLSSLWPSSDPPPSSPLSTVGSLFTTAHHYAFSTPLGTAVTSCLVTATSLVVYWRYFRRLRSTEYVTPRDLQWRGRMLTGTCTHIGDADGFRLYHQPGPVGLRSLLFPVPKTAKALKDETLSIRLAGCDAPELAHFGKEAQPFAAEAKEALRGLVEGKTVRCDVAHVDQYRRLVATPYVWAPPYVLGRTNVSLKMVQLGLATVYRQAGAEYGAAGWLSRVLFKSKSGLGRLERAEEMARRRRRGMWSQGKGLESPAEYKKRVKREK
ncbi:SNase-domain-containing protein [Jaminaea rosea]|uniref:Mediator of RNA polymerase II transcription subunit 6 n=1 Tax=Jaminaea rosea TaxID=1569628 RepID=A0A316UZJ2_9BASI|nr:SNase-domain-containing protein [Jaminaea rosea]PWN30720.1 SNase-domain-containing protein [Jaminaea rosea]